MPLYDCMLLLKPAVSIEAVVDLVARVGKHVYRRNGVLTDVKYFGKRKLGYGIKKLDGRYYEAHMMQMTMMTPPSFNSELSYLTKEDRLLRWLLVKHRELKFGASSPDEDDDTDLKGMRSYLFGDEKLIEDDEDEDEDEDDADDEEVQEGDEQI